MPTRPVRTIPDRSLSVPLGSTVRSGYVDVFHVRLACRERMAIGDMDRAYQKRLQAGPEQPWPCPHGHWDGDTFVIVDGRHEWLACVALGYDTMLVAWIDHTG